MVNQVSKEGLSNQKFQNEPMMFMNEGEVLEFYKKDKDNNQVIIYEGDVYDVKDYLGQHPGGSQLILPHLGTNIEEVFEEQEHTKSALKILRSLPKVGRIVKLIDQQNGKNGPQENKVTVQPGNELKSKVEFDYTQGLLKQIYNYNWDFQEYCEYINEPKQLLNPIRDIIFFDNWILEQLTRARWYYIPIAWSLPLLWYAYLTFNAENSAHQNIFLILVGIVYWTFGEYTLHRFLFHGEDYWLIYAPKNRLVLTFHFMIHGIHHAFPMDRYRLVFPPAPGYLVIYLFLGYPLEKIFTVDIFAPLSMGIIIGYVSYDMMHYYIHHADPKEGTFMKEMKSYHMLHHYRNGAVGFGITNKVWDKLFGTELLKNIKQNIKQQ